ncbi:MAG: DUF4124 domain-containing protein [Thiohalocapsa sp.]|nr:DUF4124 domain-containing protein [Thiohalocapsa sp.]MCF7992408.1 DUF4124 domain-containing protein [Thiohalocapsa sp.]
MSPRIRHLTVVLFMLAASADAAGGILKCVDKDGKVYFSDVACPQETRRQYIPGYKASGYRNFSSGDPRGSRNSVIEQTRRMGALRQVRQPASAGHASMPAGRPAAVRGDADKIDRRLKQLDSREESMREILGKNVTKSRRDWTYRQLDQIRQERRQLYRDR